MPRADAAKPSKPPYVHQEFPKMLFHPSQRAQKASTPAQYETMLAQGWQEEYIPDPEPRPQASSEIERLQQSLEQSHRATIVDMQSGHNAEVARFRDEVARLQNTHEQLRNAHDAVSVERYDLGARLDAAESKHKQAVSDLQNELESVKAAHQGLAETHKQTVAELEETKKRLAAAKTVAAGKEQK